MAVNGNGSSRTGAGDGRLRSWKEIASYFGADERTVKRWEGTRGLPVHRVPGEARAPVYAYEAELAAWLRAEPGEAAMVAVPDVPVSRMMPWRIILIALALVLFGLAVVSAQGWLQAASERQSAHDRVADVRQLARSQVAALSGRLEKQPGTLRLRAELAEEAAVMLGKVAALPDATPELQQEAAEAWRRLAIVQNSTERPSLRDRPAARASLAKALALVADDKSLAGSRLRARILIDAARQAASDGAVAQAPAMLQAAAASAGPSPPPALRDELLLGEAEIADWRGQYGQAIALGERVAAAAPGGAEAALRQLRGIDLAAEGHFYGGEKAAALAGYQAAATAAKAGLARWPDDPRFGWALLRHQWNVGTTLIDVGRAVEALPMLRSSRDGWMAMATRDPEDGAVASWVRIARLAYGQGLTAAGRHDAAIAELAASLRDRREWLADAPGSAERQRAVVIGIQAMADAVGIAGRRGEACGLLSEAGAIMARMNKAGALTRLDRNSMLQLLKEGEARFCPASAA